jgi:hypothetical protein
VVPVNFRLTKCYAQRFGRQDTLFWTSLSQFILPLILGRVPKNISDFKLDSQNDSSYM